MSHLKTIAPNINIPSLESKINKLLDIDKNSILTLSKSQIEELLPFKIDSFLLGVLRTLYIKGTTPDTSLFSNIEDVKQLLNEASRKLGGI